MKKLYYLLMIACVAMVACKPDPINPPDPKPVDTDTIPIDTVPPYVPLTEWEKADSMYTEQDYTIPSHTFLKIAITKCAGSATEENLEALHEAINGLVPKEEPYNMVATINGDPHTRMGFCWFTNEGITDGKVQLLSLIHI